MENTKRQKWQVKNIILATGAINTAQAESVSIENGWDRVVGVYIPKADDFDPAATLALSDTVGSIHDAIAVKHYVVTSAVEPTKRIVPISAKGNGSTINLAFLRTAEISTAVPFSIAFLLEKDA